MRQHQSQDGPPSHSKSSDLPSKMSRCNIPPPLKRMNESAIVTTGAGDQPSPNPVRSPLVRSPTINVARPRPSSVGSRPPPLRHITEQERENSTATPPVQTAKKSSKEIRSPAPAMSEAASEVSTKGKDDRELPDKCGGYAYDHKSLPKIVAVHSFVSGDENVLKLIGQPDVPGRTSVTVSMADNGKSFAPVERTHSGSEAATNVPRAHSNTSLVHSDEAYTGGRCAAKINSITTGVQTHSAQVSTVPWAVDKPHAGHNTRHPSFYVRHFSYIKRCGSKMLKALKSYLRTYLGWEYVHRRNPTAVRHRYAQRLWLRKRAQRCDCENEHSVVTAKTSTALRQRKRAQRCDCENEHSVATAKTSTALWQRKRSQRCDCENEHSVVTAKTSTALWLRKRAQRCDSKNEHNVVSAKTITALRQRKRAQHCDSENEHSVVTAKTSTALRLRKRAQRCDCENEHSVVTAKTSTALWQRKWAQRCDCENKHSVVTAKTSTALRLRKRAQRCDSKNKHSVVTAKTSTALWRRKRAQRCDSENKHSVVTAVEVTVLR